VRKAAEEAGHNTALKLRGKVVALFRRSTCIGRPCGSGSFVTALSSRLESVLRPKKPRVSPGFPFRLQIPRNFFFAFFA
jgi:hypothetical protein